MKNPDLLPLLQFFSLLGWNICEEIASLFACLKKITKSIALERQEYFSRVACCRKLSRFPTRKRFPRIWIGNGRRNWKGNQFPTEWERSAGCVLCLKTFCSDERARERRRSALYSRASRLALLSAAAAAAATWWVSSKCQFWTAKGERRRARESLRLPGDEQKDPF